MEDNKNKSLFMKETASGPGEENQVRCMGCMEEFSAEYDLCPYCGYVVDAVPKMKTYLRPGTFLSNKYMLGRVIGQGGFGITYIGWDKAENRKVAVKEFLPTALSTREEGETQVICYSGKSEIYFKEGVKKMLDEGGRLSKFTENPIIVNVYDCFEENNTSYIVMEYLEGKNLKEYAEENGGRIDPREVIGIMMPVIDALEEMHKEKMIHRDIAPDNIYLCEDGKIKLLDFGSARIAVQDAEKSLSVMVKPGYAPKEQYASRSKQGPWTDVYSVCATMYKLITGESPVESIERETTPLKTFESFGITDYNDIEEILFKGLEPEPENRIRTAAELGDLLICTLSDFEPVKEQPVIAAKTVAHPPPAPVMRPVPGPAPPAPPKKDGGKKSAAIIITVLAAFMLIACIITGVILIAINSVGDTETGEAPETEQVESVEQTEETTVNTEPLTAVLRLGENSTHLNSANSVIYTFRAENEGEYIFTSNNFYNGSGDDLKAELRKNDEKIAENDDDTDKDFRIVQSLSAGDEVTLIVSVESEVSYIYINVSFVSYELSSGTNTMYFGKGYEDAVTYTFIPSATGYYAFESLDTNCDFKAILYCNGEVIAENDDSRERDDMNFKVVGYCPSGSEVRLDVYSLKERVIENITIEVSVASAEYIASIRMFDVLHENGYYLDGNDVFYETNPSTSSNQMRFESIGFHCPEKFRFIDDTLWLGFKHGTGSNSFVWYPIDITTDVMNDYYSFEKYSESGMYSTTYDTLYLYSPSYDSIKSNWEEPGYTYPDTFVVKDGVFWLGIETSFNQEDVFVWYPI